MRRKINLTAVIFVAYSLILIWIILFKLSFEFAEIVNMASDRAVNIIPFYYRDDVGLRFHLREVVLNFVIFIPFGLYLKMLDISAKKAFLCGLLFSLALEICQFALRIGASDITDVITNTLGAVAGVCVYILMRKIFKNKVKLNTVINVMALIAIILFLMLAVLLFVANN